MQYVLLIYQGTHWANMSDLSVDDKKSIGAEYGAITQTAGVTPGLPLGVPEQATTVRVEDGNTLITDGPFVGAEGAVGGYLVLEAEHLDAATELAARIPAAQLLSRSRQRSYSRPGHGSSASCTTRRTMPCCSTSSNRPGVSGSEGLRASDPLAMRRLRGGARGGDVWRVGYQGSMSSEARRDDRAFRAVWRELRKPRILLSYLRKSGDLTIPLMFAGPTFVVLSYVVAFAVTPADRASPEFHSAASQIIPVLLLVLAIEGQVFRWEMARSSLSTASREDVVSDARFRRFAAGDGPVSDAVEAVLDAAVDTARNFADALLRQATALLLLASMLVGEVVALIPLLTDDPGTTSAKPVMAAIVAGFAGVAYVAITGSRFVSRSD